MLQPLLMNLLVVSYKDCWRSPSSPSGYATDGGFSLQMKALSQLFDETRLAIPCVNQAKHDGEIPIDGASLSVVPLRPLHGSRLLRKFVFPFWLARSAGVLLKEISRADAVHAPIPGDIGTIGMLLAYLMRRPLFVRYCGNWFVQKTIAEHFWKFFIERFAGGRNVMLATGSAPEAPSQRNPDVAWIFSTSLTERELFSALRDCHPIKPEKRLIIVCRQDKEKGTGVVIQSLPIILRSFPNISLDVVGEGKSLQEFKELAVELGVNKLVTFHGNLNHDEVINLLRQAYLFCYPTAASEGFPKVVLEALANGLPVVTTRVSVLPELIGLGCGKLINEPAPLDLSRAVIEILSDERSYLEMSNRAVETARQYSLEHWRDTIGQILQRAWGRPLRSNV